MLQLLRTRWRVGWCSPNSWIMSSFRGSRWSSWPETGATLTQATRGSILIHVDGDRGNPNTGNQGVHPYTRIWGQGQPSHRQPGGPSLTHNSIWGQGQLSHRQSGGPSLTHIWGTGATLTQATRGSILIHVYGDRGNPHRGNQGVHPYTCIWGQGQPSHRQPGGPSLWTYMGTGATLTQHRQPGGLSLKRIWGQGQPSHSQPGGPSLTHIYWDWDRGNPHTGNQGVHP